MKYSICIPNYNYDDYLEKTIDSILSSDYEDIEIVISDNKSTDKSLEIIQNYKNRYPNIKYSVNKFNIGFAGNLDCAASLTSGEKIIMLSSDDLIKSHAIMIYDKLTTSINHEEIIISSTWDIINPEGEVIGKNGPNPVLWKEEDLDKNLSRIIGLKTYKVESRILLKRSILNMSNPFNFCTVCFSKKSYDNIGGYTSRRIINPDKWFNWRLLSATDYAYFIDEPLFQYRWHPQNQTAQQRQSGHLKYLLDEYRTTIEINDSMLNLANVSYSELIRSFIFNDILRHGLGEFSKGRLIKSFRIFNFGWATYPGFMVTMASTWAYLLVLLLAPITYPVFWLLSRFSTKL